MSFQDSNQGQQPFAPPQQSWGQQQQAAQQQPAWGGAPQQVQQQPQQPQQPPQDGSGGWGAPQQQPGYGFGRQAGPGQSFGQPQDYAQQSFPQQGYPQQGYATGGPGYPPQQSDFGSGGYGYPQQGPPPNSGLATTALWLGILGGWGLINLVISILAINDTGPGKKLGRNKAIIGLCLTLVWSAVWIGIAFSLTSHAANSIATAAAPSSSFAATSTSSAGAGGGPSAQASSTGGAGSGSGGFGATGASSDPGCQAAQAAFNTYSQNAASGGLTAIATLGDALESAAGQSQVASSQLNTVGQDYVQLSKATTPAGIITDMKALDTACGMSFTPAG